MYVTEIESNSRASNSKLAVGNLIYLVNNKNFFPVLQWHQCVEIKCSMPVEFIVSKGYESETRIVSEYSGDLQIRNCERSNKEVKNTKFSRFKSVIQKLTGGGTEQECEVSVSDKIVAICGTNELRLSAITKLVDCEQQITNFMLDFMLSQAFEEQSDSIKKDIFLFSTDHFHKFQRIGKLSWLHSAPEQWPREKKNSTPKINLNDSVLLLYIDI